MLPGMPDYTVFLTEAGNTLRALGVGTWFNALGGVAVFSAIVWSMFLYLTGNALGAKNTFLRAMIALALYSGLNTASGRQVLVQMGSAWTAAHRAVANVTVRPVAQQVGQALDRLRDTTAEALGAAGLGLLGLTGVGAGAVMGIKAAQVALDKAAQVGKWLGNTFKSGVGRLGVFQTTRGLSRGVSFLTLALVVPYTAAVMLAGLMSLVALAVFPLSAAFLAWGTNRVLIASLALYLNGLLLGIVAPVVFAATVKTAEQTTIRQIYGQLNNLAAQANAENQQAAGAVQGAFLGLEQAAQAPSDQNNQSGNLLQKIQQAWTRGVEIVQQLPSQLFGAIGNALNNAASFIVFGLLSIFLWFVTLGSLFYANLVVMRAIGGAMRL